jgi:acetolactate synthase-1/3 small subunit
MGTHKQELEKTSHPSHAISVLVDNEFGVLARVVGLFSGRGYNIESLTVAEVSDDPKLSRITILTSGSDMIIEQIQALLERVVPVHRVQNLTTSGPLVQRELALIKVINKGNDRIETLRLADSFRAHVVDATTDSLTFEMTGNSHKIDAFIDLMKPLGMAELSRTGITAIARGTHTL